MQSYNLIIQNINNISSIKLYKTNIINKFILNEFDFKVEEIMDYYISFLKAISLKIDKETINYFFIEDSFPLYEEAIKFYNHKNKM